MATAQPLLDARARWLLRHSRGAGISVERADLAQTLVEVLEDEADRSEVASRSLTAVCWGPDDDLVEPGGVSFVIFPFDEWRSIEAILERLQVLPPGIVEVVGAAVCWVQDEGQASVASPEAAELLAPLAEQLVDAVVDGQELAARFQADLRAERRTSTAQLAALRVGHKRQEANIRASARYQLGSLFVDAVRRPRSLLETPRKIRELARKARGETAALPAAQRSATPRRDIAVASILDEFSHSCFLPEADLIPLDPVGWSEQLDEAKPAFLFVESAWQGNGGAWRYAVNKYASRSPNVLEQLLLACRERGIPTVFWNKEDPVNFEVFLDAARAFDSILTTDELVVPRYVEELGHDRVGALPFAAQPAIHNPIGSRSNVLARVCFAGAWRGDKYAQRGSDLQVLLDPAMRLGVLDIYDRYAGTKDAEALGFPEPYRQAVRGSLPYDEMMKAYRRYAAFLNVNSVTESPTMFSRRVFEILAAGTPVISTPSQGVEEMLGEHVIITSSANETRQAVEMLVNDRTERERRGHLGYRHVHRNHTYRHRFDQVLQSAGVTVAPPAEPLVSVISVSNRPDQLKNVFENYRRQQHVRTELVFVANSSKFDVGAIDAEVRRTPGARAMFVDEDATLAECLNEALLTAQGEYFAKMDDDDFYGPEYLGDQMLAFEYADAAVVGKRSYYVYLEGRDQTVLRWPGHEFTYGRLVAGATLVVDRRATSAIRFTPVARGTDTIFLEECVDAGLRVFSGDRYNFIARRAADAGSHTWGITDEKILATSSPAASGLATAMVFI